MAKRNPGEENKHSFLRKGVAGDWKNHFSKEARQVFNKFAGRELIKLGYEVDVDIIEELKEDVISIPDSAAFKINRQWHVFVVDGGKAVLRPIEVGLKGRDNFEILSGLEVGEIVIDAPENELTEGMTVEVTEK